MNRCKIVNHYVHNRRDQGLRRPGAMMTDKAKFRVAVFISGRGSNLEALLRASISEVQFVAVISDQPNAPGLQFAREFQIPVTIVPKKKGMSTLEFNQALINATRQGKPDLIVLAGFMRVLHGTFLQAFRHQVINIHPSLLPAFPGLDVQEKALRAGVKFSGCSVHVVTEEVDGGPMIGQAVVPIFHTDTKETLAARILKQEHILLPTVVCALARKDITIKDENGKSKVCFSKNVKLLAENASLASLTL